MSHEAGALDMDKAEFPIWAQQLIALAAVIGTAVAAIWQGRKAKGEPKGEGVVVSATMADSAALRELITCVRALDQTQREVVAELRRNTEETHDLTKNAVAIRAIMERFDAYRTAISRRD